MQSLGDGTFRLFSGWASCGSGILQPWRIRINDGKRISMDGTTALASDRISTGIAELDSVLGGGLTAQRVYLLEGTPGSGKTTIALQFLLDGAKRGEQGLYITLSETAAELS
jgi:predicted ATP-dependent serine protease